MNNTIISIVQKTIQKYPDRVAITDGNMSLSYNEMDVLSDNIARVLRERLVISSEQLIAIHMNKSYLYVSTILAILKLGYGFIPIDIDLPNKRKKYILEDSKVKVIVSDTDIDVNENISILNLSTNKFNFKTGYAVDGLPTSNSDSLAYMIYTSGSTGNPKGTLLNQKGVINLNNLWKNIFKIDIDDKVLFFSNISFDASVWEIFMALFNGSELIVPNMDVINNFKKFEQFCFDKKISVMTLPPTYSINLNFHKLTYLRLLISAGSVADKNILNKLINTNITFINAYGPTEASICSNYWKWDNTEKLTEIPIGKAIPNVDTFILDNNLIQTNKGELYIKGVGLALGYFKQKDKTDEVFINSPTLGRIYKTGDMVEEIDGEVFFKGRIGNQIKLNGYRIELDEIRKVLLAHSLIIQAEVIFTNSQIIVFYVSKNKTSITDLSEYLCNILPSYMLPKKLFCLQKIPLNHNEKPDLLALKSLYEKKEKKVNGRELNRCEKIQIEAWRKILNKNNLTIYDDFYDLGGESIKAIQIVAELFEKGVSVSIKEIMNKRQISKISCTEVLEEKSEVSSHIFSDLLPVQKWFLEEKFKNPNQWNQSLILLKNGFCDLKKLNSILNKIVSNHCMLRARLVDEDNTRKIKFCDFENKYDFITQIKVNQITDSVINKELMGMQKELSLSEGPILKTKVITSNEKSILLFVVHHFFCDGISLRIIRDDLNKYYDNEKHEKKSTSNFSDWVDDVNSLVSTPFVEKSMEFWNDLSPKIHLTNNFLSGDEKNVKSKLVSASLNSQDTSLLLKRAGEGETRINEILLYVLFKTFTHDESSKNLLFTLETHGRQHELSDRNVSQTIGWFTVQYPIYIDIKNITDPNDEFMAVRDEIKSFETHGLLYELLKYSKKLDRPIPKPLINFNYLGDLSSDGCESFKPLRVESFGSTGYGNVNLEDSFYVSINISAYIHDNSFNIEFYMNSNFCQKNKLENIGDIYIKILQDTLSNLNTDNHKKTIKVTNDFSTAELQKILNKIN
ncbi:AMP-binding protein [Listeria monocytogenes]|nr:AMP-binding protein [Listeria monocytogenes]